MRKKLAVGDICKRGHLVAGDNVSITNRVSNGEVVQRVRCKECKKNPAGKLHRNVLGGKCRNGHDLVEGNYYIVNYKNGSESIQCMVCKKAAMERYSRERRLTKKQEPKPEKPEKPITEAEERREKKLAQEARQGSGNFKALNYLKLNKRGRLTSTALETAMERNRARCDGREDLWIDYDEEDKSSWPSTELAEAMCMGCPLLRECGRHATAIKPYIGVWAGQVWYQGKIYKEEVL